ncbi:uncharacterized protein BCR38DRAFT_412932 [Pseudomassariella vexata]|uniref:Uncharacterized protein n=1 Tax=Pseudomassariella vexata TaxID=1141098 RepID=A0A1Y2DJ26_9PEZI|nr:uncharacterized protein BCR38DRAFT_412932 [Pseudomassariella vexata]ORY59229.1 hypothetical protein BCR38DRAFT_412932 [Pseudomassariella vexata]
MKVLHIASTLSLALRTVSADWKSTSYVGGFGGDYDGDILGLLYGSYHSGQSLHQGPREETQTGRYNGLALVTNGFIRGLSQSQPEIQDTRSMPEDIATAIDALSAPSAAVIDEQEFICTTDARNKPNSHRMKTSALTTTFSCYSEDTTATKVAELPTNTAESEANAKVGFFDSITTLSPQLPASFTFTANHGIQVSIILLGLIVFW